MLTNLRGKIRPEVAGKLEIELMAFKPGLSPEKESFDKFHHIRNFIEIHWLHHKTRKNSGFDITSYQSFEILSSTAGSPNSKQTPYPRVP
jgi:hypothetical protein